MRDGPTVQAEYERLRQLAIDEFTRLLDAEHAISDAERAGPHFVALLEDTEQHLVHAFAGFARLNAFLITEQNAYAFAREREALYGEVMSRILRQFAAHRVDMRSKAFLVIDKRVAAAASEDGVDR